MSSGSGAGRDTTTVTLVVVTESITRSHCRFISAALAPGGMLRMAFIGVRGLPVMSQTVAVGSFGSSFR